MQAHRNLAVYITVILLSPLIFSAEPVDFFATASSSEDANMIKMTTDLFFAQFQAVDGYTVHDRRNEQYSRSTETANIAFYAEIQEDAEGGWICTLNAIRSGGKQNVSSTKKYDTYYKILLDAKPSLENLLRNLSGNIDIPQASQQSEKNMQPVSLASEEMLDTIAGTWEGESLIEKILILRGGRGFVIFKNGASMNVSVTVDGSTIRIRQNGKPNASFFPELPRSQALKGAAEAGPIEWNMTLYGNTLSGTKTTLVADKKAESGVSPGRIDVTWTKR